MSPKEIHARQVFAKIVRDYRSKNKINGGRFARSIEGVDDENFRVIFRQLKRIEHATPAIDDAETEKTFFNAIISAMVVSRPQIRQMFQIVRIIFPRQRQKHFRLAPFKIIRRRGIGRLQKSLRKY